MPNLTPRIAVLGAGGWGTNHVRTFFELGALTLVCDQDPSRRTYVENFYPGVAVAASPSEAFDRSDIDGVVVATPAATHGDLALAAIAAGKHVLVEKPLATDLRLGEKIVDAAADRHVVLMVGHLLEYQPAFRELRALLDRGVLGSVRWVTSSRLNLGRVRTVENAMWSLAPHDIAMVLALVGRDPERITARAGCYLNPSIADVAFVGLSFSGGVEAQVTASWLHPFKEHRLVVVGSCAMAVFDDTASPEMKLSVHRYSVVGLEEGVPEIAAQPGDFVPVAATPPLLAEARHFLERIVDGAAPVTDGWSGLRVLRVLNTCEESIALGGTPIGFSRRGTVL